MRSSNLFDAQCQYSFEPRLQTPHPESPVESQPPPIFLVCVGAGFQMCQEFADAGTEKTNATEDYQTRKYTR